MAAPFTAATTTANSLSLNVAGTNRRRLGSGCTRSRQLYSGTESSTPYLERATSEMRRSSCVWAFRSDDEGEGEAPLPVVLEEAAVRCRWMTGEWSLADEVPVNTVRPEGRGGEGREGREEELNQGGCLGKFRAMEAMGRREGDPTGREDGGREGGIQLGGREERGDRKREGSNWEQMQDMAECLESEPGLQHAHPASSSLPPNSPGPVSMHTGPLSPPHFSP